MDFKEYIKPELIILIPVLYVIGAGIKNARGYQIIASLWYSV